MGQAARKLYEEIRTLPPEERQDLIQLLTGTDDEELQEWASLSVEAFAEVWDNEFDAIDDALPSR